eukprot:Gb_21646 [translate_table: standard]
MADAGIIWKLEPAVHHMQPQQFSMQVASSPSTHSSLRIYCSTELPLEMTGQWCSITNCASFAVTNCSSNPLFSTGWMTYLEFPKIWFSEGTTLRPEFWLGNQELVDMYQHRLGDAGYETYKLGRTNNRGDGLYTAVRKDHFKVVNNKELLFNDFSDRVAQLLHLQSVMPFPQSEVGGVQQEVLIVNTHLLFPHNSNFCLVRLRQAYKILEYLETFKAEHKLPPIPIILCGDWNGSKRGIVYKFLRSQGFISSYDTAHHYTDSDADAHRWVSHRNHRGNICGVDFIWLLNPNKDRKPLRTSWMEAVFGIIKFKLREAGRNGVDAFGFFKSEYSFNDHVTLTEFGQALERLGLTEQFSEGLTTEEIEDLMVTADLDGNGIMDNEEFQKMMVAQSIELSPITVLQGKTAPSEKCLAPYFHGTGNKETAFWQHQRGSSTVEHNQSLISKQNMESVPGASLVGSKVDSKSKDDSANLQGSDIGFDVAEASFFPREAEQATWPENYLLSDHAPLTAVLAPWSTLK